MAINNYNNTTKTTVMVINNNKKLQLLTLTTTTTQQKGQPSSGSIKRRGKPSRCIDGCVASSEKEQALNGRSALGRGNNSYCH
jgi:hypothetical protein